MRKLGICLLALCLMLSGCGKSGADARLRTRRDQLAAAETITFTAEVTAHLDGEVFACTLDCTVSGEETSVTVTAPEILAGVRARMRDGETHLEYDGISLELGSMEGLSPIAAGPLLASALRAGSILRSWSERTGDDALIAADIYLTDDAEMTLWFTAEDLTPCHAELRQDGQLILNCTLRDFQIK